MLLYKYIHSMMMVTEDNVPTNKIIMLHLGFVCFFFTAKWINWTINITLCWFVVCSYSSSIFDWTFECDFQFRIGSVLWLLWEFFCRFRTLCSSVGIIWSSFTGTRAMKIWCNNKIFVFIWSEMDDMQTNITH